MFGVILILAVTLMQGYLFWRASSVPFVRRNVSRKLLIGIGVALWASIVLGRIVGSQAMGSFAEALEFVSMTWMGMLFLMSVTLLVADAATGFGFIFQRFAPALRGVGLAVGGVLCLVALIQGLRAPVVQHHEVFLAGLPAQLDGTVIVALSDLHLGPMLGERWLASRVEQIRAEHPDMVVLLGDVFEGHDVPGKELLEILRRLSAPLGVWAVLGNHEFHGGSINNAALFEEAGVHLLRNARFEVRPGLALAGVDTLTASHYGAEASASLAKALAGPSSGATILLSHAPLPAGEMAGRGVGLVLCGHTHGGQLWPFAYLVGLRFPLLEGRHELGDTTLIVSRGAGTWGPPMRLWRSGEILRVTLQARASGRLSSRASVGAGREDG